MPGFLQRLGWPRRAAVPWLVLAVLALPASVRAEGAGQPTDAEDPLRIAELYVPYDQFRALTRDNADGVVMSLAEYHELIDAALANAGVVKRAALPPLAALVTGAAYRGELRGDRARVTGTLTVHVAQDGWVQCELGPPLSALGQVLVDGDPGWVLVEGGRARLLLRGRGAHEVQVAFTLPVTFGEEWATLAGGVIPASSSVLTMEVPGRARGRASPSFLQTTEVATGAEAEGRTRFRLTLGKARRFELAWRSRARSGENPVLLRAEHRVSYLPRQRNPVFSWSARVTIARRKTDTLLFQEPPGATVVRAEGPLLHRWERVAEGIQVTLKEPHVGEVALELSGLFTMEVEGFSVGPPALADAYANAGYLALLDPGAVKVALERTEGLTEIAPEEQAMPNVRAQVEGGSGGAPGVLRLFSFSRPTARAAGQVTADPLRMETRTSYLARLREGSLTLTGLVRAQIRSGRTHVLQLRIPEGWKLGRLLEAQSQAYAARGIRYEIVEQPDRIARIVCSRAADAEHPLELQVFFEYQPYQPERDWERREVSAALPTLAGAERSRTELGISLHSSLYLGDTDLEGWQALSNEDAKRAGFDLLQTVEEGISARVVAGVFTERAAPRIGLGLVHQPARGEYRAVTHILAAERAHGDGADQHALRVRCDLRLAVVDRGVNQLVISHPPLPEEVAVVVLGDGIKEVRSENGAGRQTVRFVRPWLGSRQLRIEYQVPSRPGEATSLPVITLDEAYGGERFIVMQSQGSVEVESDIRAGLTEVDLDDLPDFATAWPNGRLLKAYRFRKGGDPGALQTVVHDRAPVLTRLAREMTLHTVLGRDGSSRTLAEVLVAYAREQSLRVKLPEGARFLAVTVNGDPIRALRRDETAGGDSPNRVYAIPLPPRSFATITILYERRASAIALGATGSWSEEGPVLLGIPVSESRWIVYYPDGYRFEVSGGNLRESGAPREGPGRFARAFLGGLVRGQLPRLTAFERERPDGAVAVPPPLTDAERRGAQRPEAGSGAATRIAPRGAAAPSNAPARAPLVRVLPEGRSVELRKFGGSPRVELRYATLKRTTNQKRVVFLATFLLALLLHLGRARRTLTLLVFWGLVLGALAPPALAFDSPLVLVPFCEALAVVAALLLARFLVSTVAGWVRRRLSGAQMATGAIAVLLCGQVLLGPGALAQEPPATEELEELFRELMEQMLKGSAKEKRPTAKPGPFEAVLVPYPGEAPPWVVSDPRVRVFVPDTQFQALWKLAYPDADEEPQGDPMKIPLPALLGNATYQLRLEGDAYRLTGSVPLYLATDDWVTLALPFTAVRLVKVTVDGTETGVSLPGSTDRKKGAQTGLPALELRGRGKHQLGFELVGKVERAQGRYRIDSVLLGGAATTVAAELPEGAVITTSQSSPGATAAAASGQLVPVTVDLGQSPRLRIAWTFPEVEGQLASQIESSSYTALGLTPDGLEVSRTEQLRVAGSPVERATFGVAGSWQITAVEGNEIAEWSVRRDAQDRQATRLTVFFVRPITTARFSVQGRAVMEDAGPMPTLILEDAVRQETFVGLTHGAQRRFLPDSPSGMRRAGLSELQLPRGAAPDRLYHTYGSGAGEQLRIAPVESRIRLTTDVVAYLRRDRLLIFARSRYTSVETGPLRYQVALPAGWNVRKVRSTDPGGANALRSWTVTGTGEDRRLVVLQSGRAREGREVIWSAELPLEAVPDRVRFTPLRFVRDTPARAEDTIHWVLAADDDLQLRAEETVRTEPLTLETAPTWVDLPAGGSYRFAYRTRRPDAALTVRPVESPSRLSANVVSFARLAEDYLVVNTRIGYRVRFAGKDRLSLRLPPAAELVSADTRNRRSQVTRETPEGLTITIELQSPAKGRHTLDLVYRIPRGGSAPVLRPITLFDDDEVLAEVDQYVGVIETARTFTLETESSGLSPVEPETLPQLPRDISDRSLGGTYRATALSWSLTLREQEIEVADRLDAIIKLADLSTLIGADGTVRTQVVYTLLNESLQFLAVQLPPGADLWGVTVNGRTVAVGRKEGTGPDPAGARVLQIPVEHVGRSQMPLEVAITYEEPRLDLPALRSLADLRAPTLVADQAVQIAESIWSVQLPDGYGVAEEAGRMRLAPASFRHAEKLQHLLTQQQAVLDASRNSGSRRAQERASRELARIEQALGDNLAELEGTSRSSGELAQKDQIGEGDLRKQWALNDEIVGRAREAQNTLRRELDRKQKQPGAGSASRDEEAFDDRTSFLRGGAWRRGKASGERSEGGVDEPRTPPTSTGRPGAEGLLEQKSFAGWKGLALAGVTPEAEQSAPVAIDPKLGLRPLADAARLGTAPGLKPAEARPGYVTYTYRRSDGEAKLRLTLTDERTYGRVGAWAGMLALLGGAYWLRRRRGA